MRCSSPAPLPRSPRRARAASGVGRGLVAIVLACASGACAQFGNAHVQWDSNANPTVSMPGAVPSREFTAPADGRRTSLARLPVVALTDILTGLSAECDACQTRGHFVSRIRSACLALGPKALKAQLAKRGVRREGGTMREHYLDRVLDTIHLSPRQ